MTRKTILVGVIVLVLGAATIAFGLMLFQGQDDQPAAEQSPQQEAQQLTENEKTALEAATIMTTWRPADDFNRTDAELRASHLMTEERANRIEQPERPATGPEWNEAAQHNATSQPAVEINYFTDVDANTVAVFAEWEWITEDDSVTIQSNEERIYYFAFDDDGEIHDYTYETIRQHKQSENGK
jgi:flagellar basal body-associated protein FliL